MKNAKAKSRGRDLLPEYDFSRGVRGKYARRFAEGTNLVKLDGETVYLTTTDGSRQWVRDVIQAPGVQLHIGPERFEGTVTTVTEAREKRHDTTSSRGSTGSCD